MASHRTGPKPTEIVLLVVASLVLIGALIGAFVTWRDDSDDGGDARGALTSESTRPGTATSAPGGSTSRPATSTTSSTPTTAATGVPPAGGTPSAAGGGGDQAVATVRGKIEECAGANGVPGIATPLTYAAAPAGGPNAFDVTVTAPPPGISTSWNVDVVSGAITPNDEFATEIGTSCGF